MNEETEWIIIRMNAWMNNKWTTQTKEKKGLQKKKVIIIRWYKRICNKECQNNVEY